MSATTSSGDPTETRGAAGPPRCLEANATAVSAADCRRARAQRARSPSATATTNGNCETASWRASPSPVVVRQRECVPLSADMQLAFVRLPLDLGSLLEVLVGLGDILRTWRVSRRSYLVGVVVVEPGSDAFLLGEAGSWSSSRCSGAPPCSRRSRRNRAAGWSGSCGPMAPPMIM
jgi:hypothetical protein